VLHEATAIDKEGPHNKNRREDQQAPDTIVQSTFLHTGGLILVIPQRGADVGSKRIAMRPSHRKNLGERT
jgi:hypothetical protein